MWRRAYRKMRVFQACMLGQRTAEGQVDMQQEDVESHQKCDWDGSG